MKRGSNRRTVVVGAGSAGGIVAARLSEDPDEEVILIEAGPDFNPGDLPPDLADADRMVPRGPFDWGFTARFGPQAAEERAYPRGRLVGGSSAVNAASAARGIPEDFDAWAGPEDHLWSWTALLPFFRAVETDPAFATPGHGQSGPVSIVRTDRAEWPTFISAVASACAERGYGFSADANDPGATGVMQPPRNRVGTLRASTWLSYINPARSRPNLTIQADTEALRVLLAGDRAAGIEVIRSGGGPETIFADRVVLCAGVVNTPRILWHSGIGDPKEIRGAGLDCRHDLPGVGKSLQDHPLVPVAGLVVPEGASRFGPLLQVRATSTLGHRNDLFLGVGLYPAASLNFALAAADDTVAMIGANVARPFSRGSLRLRSSDPMVSPEIDLGLLTDNRDLARMEEILMFALEIAESSGVRQVMPHILTPPAEIRSSPAMLVEWVTTNVQSALHATGTCKMGPAGDELAVVDYDLHVRGVDDLFICDASVMPVIPAGATNMTCYMLGEASMRFLRPS
jgi:choline dehydrogenase